MNRNVIVQKVKATEELLFTMAENGFESIVDRSYIQRVAKRDVWLALTGTQIVGYCYAFVPSEEAFEPYVRERVDAIAEHALYGFSQSHDDEEILIDRIDHRCSQLSRIGGLWIDAFEIRRDMRAQGFGRKFFESVFAGQSVLALAKEGTYGFWEAVGLTSESNGFFSTPEKSQGVWRCPNGCETDHFLICGGGDIRIDDPQDAYPNLYFRILPDGRCNGLLDDGSPVLAFCLEHAVGGCSEEPVCPECKAAAEFEVTNHDE